MGSWSKAFRFTALFMVLFAAVEVLACDLLPSSDCYISHSTSDKGQGQDSGDNCLCCCAHMLVVPPAMYNPTQATVRVDEVVSVEQPLSRPSNVDHPPQLS